MPINQSNSGRMAGSRLEVNFTDTLPVNCRVHFS